MEVATLSTWWNLVYLIPFAMGLLFLVLQTMGMGGVEGGHDFDHDVDHDLDHDADHDTDHGGDSGTNQAGVFWRVASVLGIGQVPVMIVLLTFCFIWGFCGFLANSLLEPIFRTPIIFFPIGFLVTSVTTVFLTGQIARLVAKIIPKTTTFAYTEEDFVGKEAETLYSIDEKGGTIRVRDDNGTLQQYSAFTEDGKTIAGGCKVLLVRFDQDKGAYFVSAL